MRLFIALFLCVFVCFGQKITGKQLLQKAIEFHDPHNNWSTFQGKFEVTLKTPNADERLSKIHLDFPREKFALAISKNTDSYGYLIEKNNCEIFLNGNSKVSPEAAKKLRLNCKRGTTMKNYYTYLYGLPMKLEDPGTIINENVEKKVFKGKEYFVLKVNYTETVGKDVWYFYFDPTTYALEVYQFYHDQTKNDGEYILLEDIEIVNQIKMPKIRTWYYNKDNKYLGTDILNTN